MKELNYTISEHYNGLIQIKFYPKSHRYQLVGKNDFLVGVTTATGMMDKSRPLLIWASRLTKEYLLNVMRQGEAISEQAIEEAVNLHNTKKEEAAASGTLVHQWAEQFIKGGYPALPTDPQVQNGVVAFLGWVQSNGVKFIKSEKTVYSRTHQYVGTLDAIGTINGSDELHLIDFKTSSGFYPEMPMQVAAYQEAYTEEFGTKFGSKIIARFDKTTGAFEVKEFPVKEHAAHFDAFLSCLNLKKFTKKWDAENFYKKQSLIIS